MMSPVVSTTRWVIVVPGLVVDRHSHLLRVPVVEAIATSVVFVAPKVLWVVDVGIVIKSLPVTNIVLRSPDATVSSLLNLLCLVLGLLVNLLLCV